MKEITNTERFYLWMKAMGNIYLADDKKMRRAFRIVANN